MRNPSRSKMNDFLIRKGIVKDEKQANVLLVILIITFFIISGYITYRTFNPYIPNVEMTQEEYDMMNQMNGTIDNN